MKKGYGIAALAIAVAVIVTIVVVGGVKRRPSNQALRKVDKYWTGNSIDFDEYLRSKGFKPVSADPDAYVYEKGDKKVSIQDFGDYVRIGDGNGTSQQYGVNGEAYECKLSRYVRTENEELVSDIFYVRMTLEGVEAVVYWAGE